MIFGQRVQATVTAAPAEWIAQTCREPFGSVGSLVPNRFPAVLRVQAPAPCEDWWPAYRALFATIARIGERHTSTPDRAWFAMWEGHGFYTTTTNVAWREPVDDANREARARQRSRFADEDARRSAATRAALGQIPRFVRPDRSYYLLSGPVAAVTELRTPLPDRPWQRPDLFWPHDRSWFVGTDVDFWSLYAGGTHELLAKLADAIPTPTEIVGVDDWLEPED